MTVTSPISRITVLTSSSKYLIERHKTILLIIVSTTLAIILAWAIRLDALRDYWRRHAESITKTISKVAGHEVSVEQAGGIVNPKVGKRSWSDW